MLAKIAARFVTGRHKWDKWREKLAFIRYAFRSAFNSLSRSGSTRFVFAIRTI